MSALLFGSCRHVHNWWLDGHAIFPERWTRTDDYQLNWLGNLCNVYHRWTRWVRPWWWKNVLIPGEYADSDCPWHIGAWCRLRGHPRGYVYYNPGGMEPDYSCKDCGEELA